MHASAWGLGPGAWGLGRRLSQTQGSTPEEPADISDKQASVNGSEQQNRVSPAQTRTASPSSVVSNAAPEGSVDVERYSEEGYLFTWGKWRMTREFQYGRRGNHGPKPRARLNVRGANADVCPADLLLYRYDSQMNQLN